MISCISQLHMHNVKYGPINRSQNNMYCDIGLQIRNLHETWSHNSAAQRQTASYYKTVKTWAKLTPGLELKQSCPVLYQKKQWAYFAGRKRNFVLHDQSKIQTHVHCDRLSEISLVTGPRTPVCVYLLVRRRLITSGATTFCNTLTRMSSVTNSTLLKSFSRVTNPWLYRWTVISVLGLSV